MTRQVSAKSVNDSALDSGRFNAPEPKPYDFHDWQSFKDDVLRYHTTMFPEKNQAGDRIRTFRRFMTPGAVQYLRSKRPGMFEYDEFDSWDDWLAIAAALLSARDASLVGSLENQFEDVAESWARRYQDGNMSEKALWIELKALVDKETISFERQLEVFWESHSWEKQRKLVKRCPHLDPSDKAWDASTGYADRTAARRLVDDVMRSDIDATKNESREIMMSCLICFCLSTVLAVSMFILLAYIDLGRTSTAKFMTVLMIGVMSSFFALLSVISGINQLSRWASACKLQTKYSVGVWPKSTHQLHSKRLLHDAENIDATAS